MNKDIVKKGIIIAAILVVVICLIPTCKSKPGNKAEVWLPNTAALKEANLKAFDCYIDFSGSMKGFLVFDNLVGAKKTFNEIISKALTDIEYTYNIDTKTHCKTTLNATQFIEKMKDDQYVKQFSGGITDLNSIFKSAAESVSDTSMSMVVTDFVLSHGRIKCMSNPEYNIQNLSDLKGDLYKIMTDLKKLNTHVVVLQYLSDYNGKYYCNCSENIAPFTNKYAGTLMKERPYYFILMGSEKNLKSVLENECFVHFANIYTSFDLALEANHMVGNYTIDTQSSCFKIGDAYDGDDTKYISLHTAIDLEDTQVEKFTFTLDSPIKVPAFIKKDLLTCSWDSDYIRSVQTTDYKTFEVTLQPYVQLPKDKDTWFSVKTQAYNWIENCNCRDDRDTTLNNKTFELSTAMTTINLAYRGQNATFDGLSEDIAKFYFNIKCNKK